VPKIPPILPVVLAGGYGTRLWPMSRRLLPKQFLPLVSDRSMLQDAVARSQRLPDAWPPLVIVNEEHRFLAAEQLRATGAPRATVLLEPAGRGTAPAAALAAHAALERDAQAVIAVYPADHRITELDAFERSMRAAIDLACTGRLVTFGVAPAGPVTGYGYIVRGETLGPGYAVSRFVEKPDASQARSLLEKGDAFWNSGMFVFRADVYLAELARFRPDIAAAAREAWAGRAADRDFLRPGHEAFVACPPDSIDYAVMERTALSAVVPAEFDWSDLGSWDALWEVGRKDEHGNVAAGDVQIHDTANCYVRAESRMVATLGIADAVVIETSDAVLVASKDHAQNVKRVVEQLAGARRTEHLSHDRVYRPWGYYESVDTGPGYQVKRIVVGAGQALSLQRHRHRAEHWVVVSGIARVTRDDEVIDLVKNQSVYIPLGAKHRLENPGAEPLQVVEVQSGEYLGEDDIERFEDRYDRK
jgi:mannose-1-phosphate guanylyltransferase/mannose-6-phosphate isomerase